MDGGESVVEVAQGGGDGGVGSDLEELNAELVQGCVEAVDSERGGSDDGLGVRWACCR
jgi:hypothetical protein